MNSINIAFENPWLLFAEIPALALVLVPFFLLPLKRRKTLKKILPVILHGIIVTLLVLILSGLTFVSNSDDQAVILLVDASDSTESVEKEIEDATDQLLELIDKNTPVGVIVFGDNQVYAARLEKNDRRFELKEVASDATNIETAMEYAASLLPADKSGHLIILSDGKETDGDSDSTAHYLATRGVRVDAVLFDTTELDSAEVQLNSFTAPEGAYAGDEVTFSAEIVSNTATTGTLSLYDNDVLVSESVVTVTEGSGLVEIKATADTAGIHSFRLEINPKKDTLKENNSCYAYLNVSSDPTVLIIADTRYHGEVLGELLSGQNTVTAVTAEDAPQSIVELCNYDEVILCNVDYADLPEGYDELLETYVEIYGRSLLVTGGEGTIMLGNMEGTVFEEMLPVSLTLSERADGNSVALMLVLDCSMSMSNQSGYLSLAKQGAIKCVEAMSDNDYVGVISFNRSASLESPLIRATDENKDSLSRIISGLNTSQGTYYTEALELAHEELLKSNASVKHIIFLSDGQPNDDGYLEAVQAIAADGITVSTIGLDYSSATLEAMAETAGGRYYYVKSASDLPGIMLSETQQVTVNPLITGEFPVLLNSDGILFENTGIASLPNLYGYIGTSIKEEATAEITTEKGHPIYATWDYGLGTVACFTSDLYGNWSADWFASESGRVTILNMVATTVDEVHHESSFTAEITVRGKTTDVIVTTLDANSDNEMSLILASENGSKAYDLQQTEAGIYKVSLPTDQPGIYSIMITETDSEGQIVDYLETAAAVSYSAEYDAFRESGEELLAALCSYSDGAIYDDMKELSRISVNKVSRIYRPMILFAIISLILLISDIAIRKLRWKDVKAYLERFHIMKR